MTDTFVTIEKHQKGDKSGYHTFTNAPDHHNVVSPVQAEFIFRASQALTDFRKEWMATHKDTWAAGLEMDLVPILTEGMVMGYMVISEIDGESYDYAPAKTVEEDSK